MKKLQTVFFALFGLLSTLACAAAANLIATPTPIPTVTPLPTATPLPTMTPVPVSEPQSSVLFEDTEFIHSCNTESTTEVERFVENGAFHMRVNPSSYVGWAECTQVEFADFVMEADASQLGGPDNNAYGLIFRYGLDSSDFYVFAVSGDGYYALYLDGVEREAPQMIVEWTENAAVRQGNTGNHLKVSAVGSNITFYVNDQLLGEVQDTSLTTGTVGFYVGSVDDGDVHILFDNLLVTSP